MTIEDTCPNCGHKIRHPELWGKPRLTRYIFEGLCITCQDKITDTNPERTDKCCQY